MFLENLKNNNKWIDIMLLYKTVIYQTKYVANVNSSLSVSVHVHRSRYEDEVSKAVAIHIHGTNLCPKIFTTLKLCKQQIISKN